MENKSIKPRLFRILWIDDEFEELDPFEKEARAAGLDLNGYKSKNEGLKMLREHLYYFDAILLDARFFENEQDSKGSEDSTHVHEFRNVVQTLPKKFEIFILTGQADLFPNDSFNKAFSNRVYSKGEDYSGLFNALKRACKNSEDAQLRIKYQRAFDACPLLKGEKIEKQLLDLLKLENYVFSVPNGIRIVIEKLFLAYKKAGLLPSEFVTDGININESCRFLSGLMKEGRIVPVLNYRHLEETHLPPLIGSGLWELTKSCQSASHSGYMNDIMNGVNGQLLAQSLIHQLLFQLAWFKSYIDSDPIKNNWEKVN